jgi:hypothetical protein
VFVILHPEETRAGTKRWGEDLRNINTPLPYNYHYHYHYHYHMHVVQLESQGSRRVAVVEGPRLRLLEPKCQSIYSLANEAIKSGIPITVFVSSHESRKTIDYDAVYAGATPWRILPPIDHPVDPARCLVSGTGLTHLGSAKDRQAMHAMAESKMSDSMKMFQWGVRDGRPGPGMIGSPPEWFYKGNGLILRSCGEPLEVPGFAEDGGEEAEIAGIYLVGRKGQVYRLGMTIGNEFSDHKFEKKNYLNLAGSKIRTCSLGPELVIASGFSIIKGRVRIERGGAVLWSKEIETGEAAMCHSLANIEHHHFKFDAHRRPGDVHVHFFGAHSLSFGAGVSMIDGDIMEVSFPDFGKALRNPLRVAVRNQELVTVEVAR